MPKSSTASSDLVNPIDSIEAALVMASAAAFTVGVVHTRAIRDNMIKTPAIVTHTVVISMHHPALGT